MSRLMSALVVAALTIAGIGASPASAQEDPGGSDDGPTRFSDVAEGGSHTPNIARLDELGIVNGTECGEDQFCPGRAITRADMIVWLVRSVDGVGSVPVGTADFEDATGDAFWVPYAQRASELEITFGCSSEPLRFCPDAPVTRKQMASFLARAFDLMFAGSSAPFVDVNRSSTHYNSIASVAAAEITVGCSTQPLRFCPDDDVTRAQMASFLVRSRQHRCSDIPDNAWEVQCGNASRQYSFVLARTTEASDTANLARLELKCWTGLSPPELKVLYYPDGTAWRSNILGEENATVSYQFSSQDEATPAQWNLEAAFLHSQGSVVDGLVEGLRSGDESLTLTFDTAEGPVEATFSLDGVDEDVEPVLDACEAPDVDEEDLAASTKT